MENPFLYSIPHRLSYKYVLDYLNLNPEDKFLDIGCGMGQLLKLVSKHTSKTTGLDNDPDALNFARQTTNANIILGTADQLPFPDNSFNKITNILVLEHLEDDKKAISEIKRVAKNNATVIIEIPCTNGKLTHTKMHNLMHDSGTEKHFREGYTLTEIKTLLQNKGFEIKDYQYTCVYFTELFIQFTKYVYSKKNKSYESQSDILNATEGSTLFKIYKLFFPLILAACKLEDKLFSNILKGHELIVKAKIKK
ncbi:class I SAM-dependent methyltransferase [Candidatus Falkowbacteria bacterium]|nr:class I SAM-dependent methyltransferase [Candidatus Falkowbacteria bacterium]